jgi:hypothetical protein
LQPVVRLGLAKRYEIALASILELVRFLELQERDWIELNTAGMWKVEDWPGYEILCEARRILKDEEIR